MAIPIPQRGRNLYTVVLTPQTVGTAGALSDGTPITLSAKIDGLSEDHQAALENISALNSTRAHNLVIEDDMTITFRILKVNDNTDPNPLITAALTSDVFKAVWTQGDNGSAKTVTAYGSRENVSDAFEGKGKQIASLSLRQVDNGTATYART